ncbi:MAG: hypothetical protein ACTHMC_01620 [Pseudobacter sp.]|uniref:hypothetical protein n=1 Tax=Pseudobacter sp. TaxID=2045420 RepID=UPI003F7D61AF
MEKEVIITCTNKGTTGTVSQNYPFKVSGDRTSILLASAEAAEKFMEEFDVISCATSHHFTDQQN